MNSKTDREGFPAETGSRIHDPEITGHTGLLGLIGHPVGHSSSPAMHNLGCRLLGLDYRYLVFDVTEDRVPQALEAMRTLQIRGFNVTMPDKIAAAQYVDVLSPAARIIGACNTIVNDNGKLTGHITDGEGFVRGLQDRGIGIRGKKITVAGGGGAAAAIQVQCALDGAGVVSIFNRRRGRFWGRALETAEKIRAACPDCEVNVYDLEDTAKMTAEILDSDIFCNATVVGMRPMEDQSVVKDLSALRPGLAVCDAVYEPLETKLLHDAKAAGCTILNGRSMLLWQGAAAFRLFTGCDLPVQAVKERCFPELL
ncbi:MAG: shikimate dehydrogenase [Lachnospiraceae bacterium]|nr:shikimate dehydrogenase [Lachnospiraceae bacterium]